MPQTMQLDFGSDDLLGGARNVLTVDVATEAELLAFANDVRQAGGAAPLAALLPGVQAQPNACLITNALNFSSTVSLFVRGGWAYHGSSPSETWPSGAWKWVMTLVDLATIAKISEACGLEIADGRAGAGLLLPEPIGNAARAFDLGLAFGQLAQ